MTSQGANWFARQMGVVQGPTRSPALPSQSPSPGPQQFVQQQVPQQQPAVVQAEQLQITGQENYEQMVRAIEQTTGDKPSFVKMSRHWKGGEAMRQEGHLSCPKCGSMNIFTRQNVKIMNKDGKMGHAKPRCFDCGWQEDFMPGDQSNWS